MKTIKGLDSFIRMRVLQKNVDGLIVISKYLQNYYKKHKKVITLPPLVDLNEIKWNVHSEINKQKDSLTFVYSGSPGFKKDKINRVIQSLYTLRDSFNYSFIIVGINKEEYLNYYPEDEKIIDELSNKINFLGRVSHIESLAELSQADYSIFFRENNIINNAGFPTKLVESLSCGVPVITNNTSNIVEYIISGKNGYILSDNDEGLQKILSKSHINIKEMKANININQFDYHEYIDVVKGFTEITLLGE